MPCTKVLSNSTEEWLQAIRMHLADPDASYRMGGMNCVKRCIGISCCAGIIFSIGFGAGCRTDFWSVCISVSAVMASIGFAFYSESLSKKCESNQSASAPRRSVPRPGSACPRSGPAPWGCTQSNCGSGLAREAVDLAVAVLLLRLFDLDLPPLSQRPNAGVA